MLYTPKQIKFNMQFFLLFVSCKVESKEVIKSIIFMLM
jgi:hypothetical protein